MEPLPYEVPASFWSLLIAQCQRYPLLQVQDLYKLIFQAAMGSEHAVESIQAARDWLEREIAALPDGPPEPLIEPISQDGQIARVNLRPYVEKGKKPEALLRAFVRTANGFPGSFEKLRMYWSHAEALAAFEGLPISSDEIQLYFSEMATAGFPSVHHSEIYQANYHPAYRVIWVQVLEEALA
jgi:hypothetical protein